MRQGRELARAPVGAGGDSTAFAMARNPATVVTFPAPATSNAAGRFPALRSPVCFMSRFMRPIMLGALSVRQHDEHDSY